MSMKNPLISAGNEPATFRFVAQHLNHRATAVPRYTGIYRYTIYCTPTFGPLCISYNAITIIMEYYYKFKELIIL